MNATLDTQTIIDDVMTILETYGPSSGRTYGPKRENVERLVTEALCAKRGIIDWMEKHPAYVGNGQIVLTEKYHRVINRRDVNAFLCGMRRLTSPPSRIDSLGYPLPDVVYSARENKYLNQTNALYREYNQYLTADDARALSDAFNISAHANAKTTRTFRKVAGVLGAENKYVDWRELYNDYSRDYTFERAFSRFADAINPLDVTRYTIISVNPCDFLTMSIGDFSSCHTIDKGCVRPATSSGQHYNGMYAGGTISYMCDPSSVVVYTVSKSYAENETEKPFHFADKVTRQMFHVGNGCFVQGRLYPQTFDAESDGYYTQFREIFERVYCDATGTDNLWKHKGGTQTCSNHTESYGQHYRDYLCFSKCSYNYQHGHDDDVITIGRDDNICPRCGERHNNQSAPVCSSCADEEEYYCDRCGCYIEYIDDAVQIDGLTFCDTECANEYGYYIALPFLEWELEDNLYFSDYYDYPVLRDECEICTDDGEYFLNENDARDAGYVLTDDMEWTRE